MKAVSILTSCLNGYQQGLLYHWCPRDAKDGVRLSDLSLKCEKKPKNLMNLLRMASKILETQQK